MPVVWLCDSVLRKALVNVWCDWAEVGHAGLSRTSSSSGSALECLSEQLQYLALALPLSYQNTS